IYVAGQSPSGLLAGLGRLLRGMRFSDEGVRFPCISGRDFPRMPLRGMYIATHFHNYYEEASADEINSLVTDMALWGANDLAFNYPSHQSSKLSDPGSVKTLELLKRIKTSAQNMGMHTTLVQNPIFVRNNTPSELRGMEIPGVWHKGYEVCPSIPAGLALISQGAKEIIEQFDHLDTLVTWPYDGGGCGCPQCMPWGGNGFMKASKAFADEFHAKFPEGKVILSTWWFDRPAVPALRDDFKSLFSYIEKESPTWFNGLLTGENNNVMQTQLLERPQSSRYPLYCFPEIAMYKMKPWGGYGANPLPEFNKKYSLATTGLVEGGWPYSEGIYDDVNKFYWIRYFWNPEQSTDEILADYASYYLSPEVAPDAVRLFYLLEKTMPQSGWSFGAPHDVREAWALARNIDARLPAWSKNSWRWRMLFIRAAIAGTVVECGLSDPETLKTLQAFRDELCAIYHVTDATTPSLSVFKLPATGGDKNLTLGLTASTSSTHPSLRPNAAQNLTDGILGQPDNLWLHHAAKEPSPLITIDLKRKSAVAAIRLYCYGRNKHHMYVPRSVTVEVSLDGETFKPAPVFLSEAPAPVDLFQAFPAEGSVFSKEPVEFGVHEQARYVRLIFGASNDGSKAVGLGEIQIMGE
ncbi:MAG: discoidin domain-containing protein, partial [Kiritimatiellales bacterium]|nr:discoidin domain-containing protein [Kiritimatiellales bacterium]